MKFAHIIMALGTVTVLFNMSSCDSVGAYFDGDKTTKNDTLTHFYIPSDATRSAVVSSLYAEEIIDDTAAFLNVMEYKAINNQKMSAGKYEIKPQTTYKTVVNGFTRNRLGNGNAEVEVKVTFNNCKNVKEIASKVSKQIEMDSSAFVDYLMSDSILNKYGFSATRVGALFLPDTYRFYWDTDHVSFVKSMAQQFKKFWNPERAAQLKKHPGIASQSDAVTLASIVYSEQDKFSDEWKTIAGLYLNRLDRGMKLQSDPTFRFCWGDELEGVERLLDVHKAVDCPYNTYLYKGLPPGPICIPPHQVVDAVLYAEDNNYLFMCAKPDGDGRHNFARTLSEHNRNARAFQRWISEQQRKNN
ncbi:MAG: endolytic transglycosylase MltG [Bacteroidota bacterium]